MSPGESDVPAITEAHHIEAFFQAIEGKNLSEIISFADREATAAWRRNYRRHKVGKAVDIVPDRYENTLEELITFLRAALVYRPSRIDESLFDQFLQLRRKVFDEKIDPNRPVSLKNLQS